MCIGQIRANGVAHGGALDHARHADLGMGPEGVNLIFLRQSACGPIPHLLGMVPQRFFPRHALIIPARMAFKSPRPSCVMALPVVQHHDRFVVVGVGGRQVLFVIGAVHALRL